MSEPSHRGDELPSEPKPVVMKGVPISGQAERLVRVRREITHAEKMTRLEQIEAEAVQKAEAILGQARREADEMVAKARSESDGIRNKARQDGDLTAKREALQKLAGLISSLEKEIQGLKGVRADFLNSNLEGITSFACAIAQKILVSELATRPKAVANRARALLERMPPGSKVTISACPDDIEVIETYLHEAGGPADAILPALRSDPEMASGDLRLDSDSGKIDARLLDALEQIGNLLSDQARNVATGSLPRPEERHGG